VWGWGGVRADECVQGIIVDGRKGGGEEVGVCFHKVGFHRGKRMTGTFRGGGVVLLVKMSNTEKKIGSRTFNLIGGKKRPKKERKDKGMRRTM